MCDSPEVVVRTAGGAVLQDDQFTYDVQDRRVGKSTLSGGQTWTLYDGDNAYADFNGSGTLTYRYLYGKGIDTLLARFDGTNTAWYLTDKLGSVRQLLSSGGTVLDQLTYDSYGSILTESNAANGDRFKFTEREFDSEIGLQYNRARYYDSKSGQWLSQDPLGFGAGDGNLYRYVDNRPVICTDPSGLQPGLMSGGADASNAGWLAQGAFLAVRLLISRLTGPSAPKPVPPPGVAQWGQQEVQWGTGPDDAIARANSITAEEAQRLDPDMVQQTQEWYEAVYRNNPANAAAAERAKLMLRIRQLQSPAALVVY